MSSRNTVVRPASTLDGPIASHSIGSGTLEALKYLGVFSMTADHVNKYLLGSTITPLFYLGRLALPVFGFVFAYNLARSKRSRWKPAYRAIKRLFLYGLVATPAFIALDPPWYSWWPLNILFLLLVFASIVYLVERPRPSKFLIVFAFVCGGALVEFWWFGLAYCLAAWNYCRTPTLLSFLGWVAATVALVLINGNYWALAALPIIIVLSPIQFVFPRFKNTFYLYYPLHLYLILMVVHLSTHPF